MIQLEYGDRVAVLMESGDKLTGEVASYGNNFTVCVSIDKDWDPNNRWLVLVKRQQCKKLKKAPMSKAGNA